MFANLKNKISGVIVGILTTISVVSAGNVTVSGNLTVTNTCAGITGDCTGALAMWVVIIAWLAFVFIAEYKKDIIYAIVSLLCAGIAMTSAFFTGLQMWGVSSFNLASAMVILSIYLVIVMAIGMMQFSAQTKATKRRR